MLSRSFPTNLTAMVFHYQPKPNFTVQNEAQISTPPHGGLQRTEEVGAGPPSTAVIGTASTSSARAWIGQPGCALLLLVGASAVRWRRACCRCPPLDGARHRPDRHARRDPAQGPGGQARGLRTDQGHADRLPDGGDHPARRHRQLRQPRRQRLEDRPQGRRRRRAAGRGQGRSQGAHRGRQDAGRRDSRPGRQAHHRRGDHSRTSAKATSPAGLQAAADQIIARVTGEALPAPKPPEQRRGGGAGLRLDQPRHLPVHRRAGRGARRCAACWDASSARSRRAPASAPSLCWSTSSIVIAAIAAFVALLFSHAVRRHCGHRQPGGAAAGAADPGSAAAVAAAGAVAAAVAAAGVRLGRRRRLWRRRRLGGLVMAHAGTWPRTFARMLAASLARRVTTRARPSPPDLARAAGAPRGGQRATPQRRNPHLCRGRPADELSVARCRAARARGRDVRQAARLGHRAQQRRADLPAAGRARDRDRGRPGPRAARWLRRNGGRSSSA